MTNRNPKRTNRDRWVLGLVLLLLMGCKKSDPPANKTEPQDGHARMLGLLDDIRQRTPKEHPYLGTGTIPDIKSKLSQLSDKQPSVEKVDLLSTLGYDELRVGKNEQAAEHLQMAYDLLPQINHLTTAKFRNNVITMLGVAYLRLGETDNCIHCETGESCLLPIRSAGVHVKPRGSLNAIKYFEILLAKEKNLNIRWLLNVAYMTVGKYPDEVPKEYLIPPEAFESEREFLRFVNIASELGINTFSLCGGTIVDDFDDDGFLDIMTSTWNTAGQIRYFHNNKDGTFVEQTKQANLTNLFGGLNLIQADYDNDGDVDVLVLRGAWLGKKGNYPNSLLQNDGTGRFRDVTFEAGLGREHHPTQTAAWGDFDNDGDLDLYIGNEHVRNQLFENDGQCHFKDIGIRAGVADIGISKGVVWGDYNNDGYPDLYVSNLNGANRLYRNNRNGSFFDVAKRLGVEQPMTSFPTWFWDYNNDGILDIYVASYDTGPGHVAADYLGLPHDAPPDRLYQGDGHGGFHDVAKERNLTRATQPMGSNFGDVDNDGFPDFYLGTGAPAYEILVPNLFFHNQRGEKFSDVTAAAGLGHLQKGHGVAFGDLDNDGDQDIFIELGGAFSGDAFSNALFENPGFGNNSITIKLIGKRSNRSAIGARIRVQIEEPNEGDASKTQRSIYKWVNSGGSFGANPLRQEIGLGKATRIQLLEVFWPTTGETQQFDNIAANQFIEITEGKETLRQREWKTVRFRRSVQSSRPTSSPAKSRQTKPD